MAWNSLSQIEKGSKIVDLLKLPANWKKIHQNQLRLPSKSIYQGACLCCFVKTCTVSGPIPQVRCHHYLSKAISFLSWKVKKGVPFWETQCQGGRITFWFRLKTKPNLVFWMFLRSPLVAQTKYMFSSCSYSVLVHYFIIVPNKWSSETLQWRLECLGVCWKWWSHLGEAPNNECSQKKMECVQRPPRTHTNFDKWNSAMQV